MKKYYDKKQTPLAFHAFFRFISLPIAFFTLIIQLPTNYQAMLNSNWLYTIDFIYVVLSIVLVLACFIGFWGWKSYAWYSVISYLYLQVGYRAAVVIVYFLFSTDALGTYLGEFLGVLIYAVLVGIYYKKRKPLFVHSCYTKVSNVIESPTRVNSGFDNYSMPKSATDQNKEHNNAFVIHAEPVFSDNTVTAAQKNIYSPYATPEKKQTKATVWLVVALIVACLVIVGLCVFMYAQNTDRGVHSASDFTETMHQTEYSGDDMLASTSESVLYLEIYNKSDECIGSASGFLVNSELTLVTNYHVIQDAHRIIAWTQDDKSVEVSTLLAYDEIADLAILRCDLSLGKEPLILANSDEVKRGMSVYAIGYPLGLANTISDGIVSARYIDEYGNDTVQTTAAISNGNSGGPLVNEYGQVVGIMCAYYVDGQNLNVAIASNTLQQLMAKDTNATKLSKWTDRPLMPDQEISYDQENEPDIEPIPEETPVPDVVEDIEPDYEQETVPEAEYEEPVVPISYYSSLWDGTYDTYLFKVETETLDYLHDAYYVFDVANNMIEYTSGIYTYTFTITSIDENRISSYNIAAPEVVFRFYRHADGTVLMYHQQQAMYSEVLYKK